MAEIFAFPAATKPGNDAAATGRPDGVPDDVWHAVESARAMERVPAMRYREMAVPVSLADFGIGVELESERRPAGGERAGDGRSGQYFGRIVNADETAHGWIMLLYSRTLRADWRSRWRCVAFASLPLETRERDGLTPAMYWDDMRERLANVLPGSLGGTVTVTHSTSFGTLKGGASVGCEMRVSWTPLDNTDGGMDAGGQIRSWARFVGSASCDEEEPSVDR
ncbi:DUF3000 family protein [Bifidobacterium biavatii]|uniref:Permease n=1 Tax=Bifidobacterium biavatii DSM 23969 TaxID=1437608 RepID=A0A086ZEI9_9BIFI|nr:DUF3000 family protein [Bifidobacterium biavatii]KFI44939.1 hypothetical protein BBIA_2256 [Bifidobacterium biavatii DSM 23969]